MGEKEEMKNEVAKKPAAGGENKAADGGGKADEAPITVVLKMDLHCEGCAKKVRRSVTHLEGVEKVKADCNAKKLTVTGNVDPVWLREKVESKTKKKVELVSPQPKKDAAAGVAAAAAGGDKKADEKSEKKTEIKKADEVEKPKEAVVSTVVMKIRLHCDGCANKIQRVILKNVDGVNSVTTDLQKDMVTVIGTMNVNELTTYLKQKLQRSVEVVPPKKGDDGQEKKENEGGSGKKDKEGSTGGGGEKEKKSGTGDGGGGSGGDKKEKESGTSGGDGGERKDSGNDKKETETKVLSIGGGEKGTIVEVNKAAHHSSTYNPETYYATPMYSQTYESQGYDTHMYHHQGYYNTGHAVQYTQGPPPLPPPTYLNMNDNMFSDENPNGCSVM